MATMTQSAGGSTTQFVRRFMGALALDPATFEDVESDRTAGGQAALVVLMTCLAGGFAVAGSSQLTVTMFIAGLSATLGAWVVWALLITTIGTLVLPEPTTSSRPAELLRTMGFGAAPGVFLAFGAMQAAAPFAVALATLWMVAATVLAVRQALDYRSLGRAVIVCVAAGLVAFGMVAAAALLFARPVT